MKKLLASTLAMMMIVALSSVVFAEAGGKGSGDMWVSIAGPHVNMYIDHTQAARVIRQGDGYVFDPAWIEISIHGGEAGKVELWIQNPPKPGNHDSDHPWGWQLVNMQPIVHGDDENPQLGLRYQILQKDQLAWNTNPEGHGWWTSSDPGGWTEVDNWLPTDDDPLPITEEFVYAPSDDKPAQEGAIHVWVEGHVGSTKDGFGERVEFWVAIWAALD